MKDAHTSLRLHLFDDARARVWAPFTRTRPVGELLHGCLLQRERWERVTGAACVGHLTSAGLAEFREEGAPPVLETLEALEEDGDGVRLVVSSRAVPEGLNLLKELRAGSDPATLVMDGEVVGWRLPPGRPLPDGGGLLDPAASPDPGERVELSGSVLGWPWDLVRRNAARTVSDLAHLHGHGDSFLLTDVHVLGDRMISLGRNVHVEAGVVIDVRQGPVRLEDGVRVEGPARLTGPLWVGHDTRILGGSVGHSSVGPVCKVRGEVDSTVFLGWANKAHDGYLGHALVGRWVNLGAGTTNSDLKNSYSAVRVPVAPDRSVDTGLLKVGCFLGDHVKTGIGTLLNTGTVIGAGSNVFGGRMPPTYVPAFSWGSGDELTEYRLEKFLEVAATTMARRDVELGEPERRLLTRAWERSRPERQEPLPRPSGAESG